MTFPPPVHGTASAGFVDGELYERGRPDYPPKTIEPLGVERGTPVVDVGCGTGKFTRLLASATTRVVGVEPLEAMRLTFTRRSSGIDLIGGVAEALPFTSSTFEVATFASAFHWIDHGKALPEIARVLRPGGRLGIVWNRRDEITGWAEGFWAITEAHRRGTPSYRTPAWREALGSSADFSGLEEHRFPNVQRVDIEGLLARVGSISFIETLPAAQKDDVLRSSREFVLTHPQTRGLRIYDLPYRTVVYVARRR